MKICALIPAYNEEAHLAIVLEGARRHLPDVLVVDDGSSDSTAEVARAAGAEVLRHDPNKGKGVSLRDGLDWAAAKGFDAVVTLDADGQHLTEEIPRFLAVAEQYDLLIGNRMSDVETMPWARLRTNQVTSGIVSRLATVRVHDSQCGFRLIRTSLWTALKDSILSCNYDFESEIIVAAGRAGLRVGEVPVSTVYGDEVSAIHPVRDTIRFFQMVWRLR